MLNIIYTEILKLKRAKIMWLLLIGGILPSALDILIVIENLKYNDIGWKAIFQNNILFMSLMMAVVLFSLFSGYVFSREYTENTVNSLYTYPVDKCKFVFSKLIVIYIMIFITLAINIGSLVGGGIFIIKEPLTFVLAIESIKNQLFISILFFSLSPVGAVLGVIGKNVIAPIALGISAVITNIIVVNSKYANVFPWSIPTACIFRADADDPNMVLIKGCVILAITFIVSLITLIIYLKKTDVHV